MPPKARVEQQLLRLFFNTSDIVGNVAVENLTEIVLRSKDGSLVIAKAHRYVFPDGMIGGSGRPDPNDDVLLWGDRVRVDDRSAAPSAPLVRWSTVAD